MRWSQASAPGRETPPAETLTAIIREDPQPPDLRQRPRARPPPLRWIVDRCLAKEPDERYASTRDLARDLADGQESPERDQRHGSRGRRPPFFTPHSRRAAPFSSLRPGCPWPWKWAILLAPLLRRSEKPRRCPAGLRWASVAASSGRAALPRMVKRLSTAPPGTAIRCASFRRVRDRPTRARSICPQGTPVDLVEERARLRAQPDFHDPPPSAGHPRPGLAGGGHRSRPARTRSGGGLVSRWNAARRCPERRRQSQTGTPRGSGLFTANPLADQ